MGREILYLLCRNGFNAIDKYNRQLHKLKKKKQLKPSALLHPCSGDWAV